MSSRKQAVRVLHIVALHGIGGVETLFHSYLAQAGAKSLEHHVLVRHGLCHPNLAAGVHLYAASVSCAQYWHGLRIPPWPRALRASHFHSILDRIKPEVIVLYDALSNAKLWAAIRNSPAKKVHYEHGAAWTTHFKPALAEHLANVDLVLCNSYATRRMLELRWGLRPGVARVVLNPLRSEIAAEQVEPKRLDPRRPLRLGLAGRMISYKGFPLALQALRLLRDKGIDCTLDIAGAGVDEPRLRALVARLDLETHVRFLGLVHDMVRFYREIDLFLFPSVREPLGNVAVEAGYMACPVICAAVDGIPEVVLDGRTGYCITPSLPVEKYAELGGSATGLPALVYDPARDTLTPPQLIDPEAIAEKVAFLHQHPEVFSAMSAAAHQHISSAFTMRDYAREINRAIFTAAGYQAGEPPLERLSTESV